MALEVEDGTGKTNADSYESVANADTYATSYGLTAWNASSDVSTKEVALRNGTLIINTTRTYVSEKLNSDQSLEFPRKDESIGLPQRVKDACVIFADLYLQGVDLNQAGEVLSEISVGVGSGAVEEMKKFASPYVIDITVKAYNLLREYIETDPTSGLTFGTIYRS